jgi:hypothetical protein
LNYATSHLSKYNNNNNMIRNDLDWYQIKKLPLLQVRQVE